MAERRRWTPLLLDSSLGLSNNMGEHCCGESHKRKGKGIFTHQYEQNIEMGKLRSQKISDALNKLSYEDRMFIDYEFNQINKISSEILANNHSLRSQIFDLQSQIDILNIRVRLVRESSSIDEAKRLTYFPRESQFTKIND